MEVYEICVVNVDNASYAALEFSDGTHEVRPMSFLLVCTYNPYANHCTPCWGGAVALSKALGFD